jgi:hypothetical protein
MISLQQRAAADPAVAELSKTTRKHADEPLLDVYLARGLVGDYVTDLVASMRKAIGLKTIPTIGLIACPDDADRADKLRATCELQTEGGLEHSVVFVLELMDDLTELAHSSNGARPNSGERERVVVRYGRVCPGELDPDHWVTRRFEWTPYWWTPGWLTELHTILAGAERNLPEYCR